MNKQRSIWVCVLPLVAVLAIGCGGEEEDGGPPGGRGGAGGGMGARGGPPGGGEQAAVPVEAAAVERRTISSYIETNGTLEAENEVDVVARAAGPIVQLNAEETMRVRAGDLLARIDPKEIESQLEISRVALEESKLAFERAERLLADELLSQEAFDDAKAAYDSARAQFESTEIQLGYTEIRAPFDGQIIERYVKFAQNVGVGESLFRLSDFDPLLCPIQVPERNIPDLETGQRAYLEVEAWPGERFEGRVLRLSPVVEAATGTVRVTLEVEARGKLRPGMFASVYLETEVHENALVIPRKALTIESIGDTVYVVGEGAAIRREVELGVREGDTVEIVKGVTDGERVVTVGQDGLSDGTPIQVLGAEGAAGAMAGGFPQGRPSGGGERQGEPPAAAGAAGGRPGGGGFDGQRPDLSRMTPEQVEQMKERMRSSGMTDEQIEQRLQRMREAQGKENEAAEDGSGTR